MRRVLATLAVAALAAGAGAVPATADPPGPSAQAQAGTLRAELDRLQTEAERATESYDAAQARLDAAVTAHLSAEQQLDELRATAADAHSRVDERVRGLYMAGGQAALIAGVLDARDPTELFTRYHEVAQVVSADRDTARRDDARVATEARLTATLADAAAARTSAQTAASTAATTVQRLLDRQRELVAAADAEVRRLAAAQQAAELAADAQTFAAELAAAQAGAGLPARTTGAASPVAAAAIAAARTRLGLPYVWGAAGPDSFDCSGLVQWAYRQAGLSLPRVAADQWNTGPHPTLAELAPGDLLFWADDPSDWRTIHHVAIYLGGGMMLAAPHTGDVVKIQPVYATGFFGATRPTAS